MSAPPSGPRGGTYVVRPQKRVAMSVKVIRDTVHRIALMAQADGVTKSSIVDRAVNTFLAEHMDEVLAWLKKQREMLAVDQQEETK